MSVLHFIDPPTPLSSLLSLSLSRILSFSSSSSLPPPPLFSPLSLSPFSHILSSSFLPLPLPPLPPPSTYLQSLSFHPS